MYLSIETIIKNLTDKEKREMFNILSLELNKDNPIKVNGLTPISEVIFKSDISHRLQNALRYLSKHGKEYLEDIDLFELSDIRNIGKNSILEFVDLKKSLE